MSSCAFCALANSVTVSRNLVWTASKYSVRWMTVSLPAAPTGKSLGTGVAAAAAAVVGAVVAGAPGGAVAVGAEAGGEPPQAASSTAPVVVMPAIRNLRRDSFRFERSWLMARFL